MQTKEYPQLNETLYTETLENGLQVVLLPKPDFNKTYALFGTDFGSIDQHFTPIGKSEPVNFPDGIAHFLEHKMFEKEDGDIFHEFSKYGAAANAFTSFTRTAYLFSTTHFVEENLKTLLDFVQAPYFTEETVEKEKGIIAQEIGMYEDEASFQLMMGILQNLYPDHPVHIDILGTVESINQITADMLYDNYNTFYHPSNMTLLVVGQIEPEETMALIRANQEAKDFPEAPIPNRIFPEENLDEITAEKTIYMPIQKPKVSLGIRGLRTDLTGEDALRYEIAMSLYMEMLLGPTSETYLSLYDEGIIDDSYSTEFLFERTFNTINVSTDTKQPEEFKKRMKAILLDHQASADINPEHFELIKRKTIGKVLQALNSLEYIAYQFMSKSYGEATVFDFVPFLEEMTLEETIEAANDYIREELLSVFTILPEES
ncbi:EF-P 5-aminopentanol modification-associated protein YfmH [Dolosigranulum savutiense]|uniref:Pitrilysin family protein n=1 Tax=Dolosigranulum savutiense TaxID=3110288 RepID=A0AB74TS17_9LACT